MAASPEVQALLEQLRPCSGCAGNKLDFMERAAGPAAGTAAALWRVSCSGCCRQSLSHTTPAAAVEDWNRRAIEDGLLGALKHRENIIEKINEAIVGPNPGCP